MLQRHECETELLQQLDWARRAMQALCRRHRMTAADIDDFISWALLRLIENEYHVLRQFRGDSSLRTYLTVVFAMLHREFRAKHWGRWRPCAAARRGGPAAIELDRLVNRDGLSVRDAVQLIRSFRLSSMTELELMRLASELPVHAAGATAKRRSTDEMVSMQEADELVTRVEAENECSAVQGLLGTAIERLPSDDQLLLRMRFWQGLTIAEIARRLDVQQKPLYRRLTRILAEVRACLEVAGLSGSDAIEALREVAA